MKTSMRGAVAVWLVSALWGGEAWALGGGSIADVGLADGFSQGGGTLTVTITPFDNSPPKVFTVIVAQNESATAAIADLNNQLNADPGLGKGNSPSKLSNVELEDIIPPFNGYRIKEIKLETDGTGFQGTALVTQYNDNVSLSLPPLNGPPPAGTDTLSVTVLSGGTSVFADSYNFANGASPASAFSTLSNDLSQAGFANTINGNSLNFNVDQTEMVLFGVTPASSGGPTSVWYDPSITASVPEPSPLVLAATLGGVGFLAARLRRGTGIRATKTAVLDLLPSAAR